MSAPSGSAPTAPKDGASARRSRARADTDGHATGVRDARAQHQPDRPEPDDRHGVAPPHAGYLDPVKAARERLGHRSHLGCDGRGDRKEVPACDALRHEQELRVGAVQKREEVLAERLLPALAGCAGAARRRVCGDDASPRRHVDPAHLVPERAGRRVEQDRMTATVGLHVGSVRERYLDLEEDVALAGNRVGHLVEPQVAGCMQAERPHGVKTTFRASRRRKSSSPSAKRSSGRSVGSGTSRSSRSATASDMYGGAAERVPRIVSSRR